MKYILYATFLLSTLFACTQKAQDPQTLDVTWYILVRYNDTLDQLPWKLLDAIDAGKIKTYDSSLKELSRAEIESKITLGMRDVFLTKEECEIMAANGDFSFGEYLEPKQSAKELERLYSKGQDIDSLLILTYRPAFESKVFQLELVEKVKLDTSVRRQMGSMQYIRLITPKEFTKSGNNEILCQVKYEDFKTLAMPEQKIIDNHEFMIITDQCDLTVDDGEKVQRLSSLQDPKNQTIQLDQIRNSIFKYFSKNILIVDTIDESSKAVLMKQIDY